MSGAWVRSVLFTVVAAGVVGTLAFSELSTTDELLAFQDSFVGSGGNVIVATSEAGLASDRCAALVSMPGVIGSAGLRSGPPLEVSSAPGTLFNTGETTVGALSLFSSEAASSVADVADGWIVGASAASELGVAQGMWLGVGGTPPRRVGAVIDTHVRNPRIDRWMLTTQPPTGTVTECWVEFASGVTAGREETVNAVFADTRDVIVVPWIRLDEFSRDPVAELALRPQASAWIVAGLFIGMVGWLITWFRRSQIGLYRAVGTGPSALLVLGATEYLVLVIVGALIGSSWAAALWVAGSGGFPGTDQFLIAMRTVASTVLVALVVGSLLWPIAARGSIARQLKND